MSILEKELKRIGLEPTKKVTKPSITKEDSDISLYTCCETGQTMSKVEWFLNVYIPDINKKEYKDFCEWWADMIKSHVLEEV